MVKIKILKRIVKKYNIRHGDLININKLKYISTKENIEINDLMIIFRISESNRNRIRQNLFANTKIYIFNTEDLKEIKGKIMSSLGEKKKFSEEEMDRLCEKYRINMQVLDKMLINGTQKYQLEIGQKDDELKYRSSEKEIIKDLFIKEVKYKEYVDKKFIEYGKEKYNLEDEEICYLLKVKVKNYKKLMNNKTKVMKINLIDEYEKLRIEQNIIGKLKNQDYITKGDIIKLKKEIRTTNSIIKQTLSISNSQFSKLMRGEIRKARIIFKNIKLNVNYLLMDIKYEYGERYYSSSELKCLCKKYKVELDEFLKNISTNINRYPYIKRALKENSKGIYIGEEHRLSNEFLNKYDKRLQNMCERITNKYCYFSHLRDEKSDIEQEALLLLWEKGGNIEKNFSYDLELLFNLLAKKVKYFIIGIRNKRYSDILLGDFDKNIKHYDEYKIYNSNFYDFVNSMDSKIKLIHQNVMSFFLCNKDYIYYNRKSDYKVIAYRLKISLEYLNTIIKEIKELYIEYGFAKICENGNVIDMSDCIF